MVADDGAGNARIPSATSGMATDCCGSVYPTTSTIPTPSFRRVVMGSSFYLTQARVTRCNKFINLSTFLSSYPGFFNCFSLFLLISFPRSFSLCLSVSSFLFLVLPLYLTLTLSLFVPLYLIDLLKIIPGILSVSFSFWYYPSFSLSVSLHIKPLTSLCPPLSLYLGFPLSFFYFYASVNPVDPQGVQFFIRNGLPRIEDIFPPSRITDLGTGSATSPADQQSATSGLQASFIHSPICCF